MVTGNEEIERRILIDIALEKNFGDNIAAKLRLITIIFNGVQKKMGFGYLLWRRIQVSFIILKSIG